MGNWVLKLIDQIEALTWNVERSFWVAFFRNYPLRTLLIAVLLLIALAI